MTPEIAFALTTVNYLLRLRAKNVVSYVHVRDYRDGVGTSALLAADFTT